MKKRILSMVLSVIMVLSLVPMTAFATESGMEEFAIQIPIKITVEKGGNVTPPAVDFELELYDFSAPPEIDMNESITVSGSTVSTNGENTYDAVLTVTPNDEQIMSFLSDGFFIRQKQGNAEHWTYSDAAYFIRPYSGDDGLTSEIEETSTEQTFAAAEFVNTYTENIAPHSHEWSTEWSSDATHHWHECIAEGCDKSQKNDYDEHTPEADDGDCTTAVKCSVCGCVLVEAKEQHSFKNYEYDNNASYEKDGTETAKCVNEGCNVTHTRTKEGTKKEATKTVTVGDFILISDSFFTDADYSFENGVLTLKGNGPYTLKMKEGVTKTSNRVVIASTGNITLTLDGVNIDCGEIENASAMRIDNNAGNVTIILSGTNTFQSGKNCAGLQKDSGKDKNLTIKGDGSFTAIGGNDGAGIGGGFHGNGSNITISGGTVTANGGSSGAGIGGGNGGFGTDITISGGTVTANGGSSGAGIGGGNYGHGTNNKISPQNGSTFIVTGDVTQDIQTKEIDISGWEQRSYTITFNPGTVVSISPKIAVKNGYAEATVSEENFNTLIGKVQADSSAKIGIIDCSSAESVTSTEIAMNINGLNNWTRRTTLPLKVQTNAGSVTLSTDAAASIVEQADRNDVRMNVSDKPEDSEESLWKEWEKQKQERKGGNSTFIPTESEDNSTSVVAAVEVNISAGNKPITNFDGAIVTLNLPIIERTSVTDRELLAVAISEDASIDYMKATVEDDTANIDSTHTTTFIVTDIPYSEYLAALSDTDTGKPAETTSPQTGDNSNIILWVALLFVSGTALVGTTVYGRKKRKVR